MKKLFITICCIALAGIAYTQSDTLNRTDKFGKKYGYWKVYDEKKVLQYEGRFYNGEPVGKMIHYYPNGKVKSVSIHTPNSPKVTSTLYHENGVKSTEGIFINKQKDGEWMYYNTAGKLISEEHYVNCKRSGPFRIYSPKNGVILEEINWKDGKKEGPAYNNFSNGKLRLKMYYKDNKMDGPFENYYEDGKLWTKGTYKEDFRDGEWTTYNEQGKELVVQVFEKGQSKEMWLGFNNKGNWIKLNVKSIAYFEQQPANIVIALKNGKTIEIWNDQLVDISKRAGMENFIFLNENFLSSYTAIKKVIPEDETNESATIIIKPEPCPEGTCVIICDGDYYKMLKSLLNDETPKED